MSEYYHFSSNDDYYSSDDSTLWKDVTLCSALYQRRMRMDFDDCAVEYTEDPGKAGISLTPDNSVFGCQDAPDSGRSDNEFIACLTLDTPTWGENSNDPLDILNYDIFDQTSCFNILSYLDCNDDFDSLQTPDFNSNPSTDPFSINAYDSMLNINVTGTSEAGIGLSSDVIISQVKMNYIGQPMSEDEDVPSGYNAWNSDELNANISSEENDDCQSTSSYGSYRSTQRNNRATVVNRSPSHSCQSDSSATNLINSQNVVKRLKKGVVAESPRSLRRATKTSSTNDCYSRKSTRIQKSLKSYDNDDEDFSEYRRSSKRATRVSHSSKRARNLILEENKNAVQARINREKKKAYISSLERRAADLESENASMRDESELARIDADSLIKEIGYLKSVLMNRSELADFLENINCDDSIRRGLVLKRISMPISEDHSYTDLRGLTAGVCLHVNQERLTMELCRHCSQKSNARHS